MGERTAISLFCGAGGLDMGFERAGFRTVWANDHDADACATRASWGSARVVLGDVAGIDAGDVPDADVMLGGFPCQGFSLSGPRKIDDSRNSLYRHYVRFVKAKRPKAFVGENVKGLLSMGGGAVFEAIVADFAACGYEVRHALLNAKDHGVAEDRERVILVGIREDVAPACGFVFPEPSEERATIRGALSGLSAPLPEEICRAPYSSRYMSRNRKRGWDDVSYTIPAMAKQVPLWPGSPDMAKEGPDRWRFGEDGETRRFSWREAAAIQAFPNDLEFVGRLDSKYRQIGNAVPPLLAEAVAKELAAALDRAGA